MGVQSGWKRASTERQNIHPQLTGCGRQAHSSHAGHVRQPMRLDRIVAGFDDCDDFERYPTQLAAVINFSQGWS